MSATNLFCGGGCGFSYPRSEYNATQRDRGAKRKCPSCVNPTNLYCAGGCGSSYPRSDFSNSQLRRGEERKCPECASQAEQKQKEVTKERASEQLLQCAGPCNISLARKLFTATQLQKDANRVCKTCSSKGRVC